MHLHSDSLALRAPPFSLLVVDVPLEFLHGDFGGLAGHGPSFDDRIALNQPTGRRATTSPGSGKPHDKLPQSHDGTIYEVRIIGDPKVYKVNHAKMMEWANRQGSHGQGNNRQGSKHR